jgi:hypothetical protein
MRLHTDIAMQAFVGPLSRAASLQIIGFLGLPTTAPLRVLNLHFGVHGFGVQGLRAQGAIISNQFSPKVAVAYN